MEPKMEIRILDLLFFTLLNSALRGRRGRGDAPSGWRHGWNHDFTTVYKASYRLRWNRSWSRAPRARRCTGIVS